MSMATARILIVEDERIIAADLKRHITRLGYDVVGMVGSGRAAIEQAQTLCPDVVLMDIGLPGGMSGLEAAGNIWEALHIPVVYVTAYVDDQTLGQVLTPAPLLVVRKPFDARQLQTTLAQVLSRPPLGP
jgi:CheY-like chemotaxis protein